MKQINCFIPFENATQAAKTIENLSQSALLNKIYLLSTNPNSNFVGYETIVIDNLQSSSTMRKIAAKSDTEYSLIYTKYTTLETGQFALERFARIASDTKAGLVYSDYYEIKDGNRSAHPVIDYQEGSLRDDFNFGSVLFYNAAMLRKAVEANQNNYQFAGLYDLRLRVSQQAELFHINEYLYTYLS